MDSQVPSKDGGALRTHTLGGSLAPEQALSHLRGRRAEGQGWGGEKALYAERDKLNPSSAAYQLRHLGCAHLTTLNFLFLICKMGQ